MKKKNTILSIAILIFTLGVIIAGWLMYMNIDMWYIHYDCSANQGSKNDNFVVLVSYGKESNGSLKKWKTTFMIGAEYDFTIYNNTKDKLTNWSITIQLPKGSYIDSYWDGEFYVDEEGVLTSQTLDYNAFISPGSNRSFGFILYTPKELDLQNLKVEVKGMTNFALTQNEMKTILTIASALWACAFSLFLFDIFRSRSYERQRMRDQEMITQSIKTFTNFIDAKDPYTRGHSNRVALYSREIAKRMKLSSDEIELLYYIALMHDAGKIGISDAILNKPGFLDTDERTIIQSHTTIGGEMLRSFSAIPGICDGALYHHERYDGKGYPTGLAGEDIPLYARIICIADAYDAMSSNRCYRKHLEEDVILHELENNAGSQFDPRLVTYMIDMIRDGFTNRVQISYASDKEEA